MPHRRALLGFVAFALMQFSAEAATISFSGLRLGTQNGNPGQGDGIDENR